MRYDVMGNFKWISLIAAGSIFLIAITVLIGYSLRIDPQPSYAEPNLSNWQNKEDRVSLLPALLNNTSYMEMHETPLPPLSPIYGLSEQQVILVIGSPDYMYDNELVYRLGELKTKGVVVREDATLHLYFSPEEGCVKFLISS